MGQLDWDGIQRLGDLIALAVVPYSGPLQLVAVCADTKRCIVRPEHLGNFLTVHRDAVIACHDAGRTHWALAARLEGTDDRGRLEILWQFSRKMRLHDVGLLDQLLALAQDGIEKGYQALRILAAASKTVLPPDSQELQEILSSSVGQRGASVGRSLEEAILAFTDAVWAVYLKLITQAREIAHEKVSDEYIERFGPLCLGVQVQAAIALQKPTSIGSRLRKDALQPDSRLWACCDEIYGACSRQLRDDTGARACFDWDSNKLIARDEKGHIRCKKKKLAKWLIETLAQQPGLHDIPFEPPRVALDKIAMSPTAWGDLVECHPLLRAWADLEAAAQVKRTLMTIIPGDPLRPVYEVLPRIASRNPNLEQLRQIAAKATHSKLASESRSREGQVVDQPYPTFDSWTLFEPLRPGKMFMIELPDLELRCLASICESEDYGSTLAELFREGDDPVLFVAKNLYQTRRLRMESARQFEQLQTQDPRWYRDFVNIARAILQAAPRGLAPRHVRYYLPLELDSMVPAREIESMYRYVVFGRLGDEGFLDELGKYLADRTRDLLQDKLRCAEIVMLLIFGDEKYLKQTDQILRDTLSGRLHRPDIFESLLNARPEPPWRERLLAGRGSPELYRALFEQTVATGLGRVRGHIYFNQAVSCDFLDLADDVMKVVLYEVVRSGYELVGLAGDQFAVLSPTNVDRGSDSEAADRIRSLIESSVKSVRVDLPISCRVECRHF